MGFEPYMRLYENMHASGASGISGIDDVDVCNNLCIATENCVGVDWNFKTNPWMGYHCWIHTDSLGGALVYDAWVHHYEVIRYGDPTSSVTIEYPQLTSTRTLGRTDDDP